MIKESARSQIYLLRHKTTGQRCILRRYTGSGAAYQRLLGIRSPYLPQVYEAAEENGVQLVLEEYVSGDTLADVLTAGHMNYRTAKPIMQQLCRALWVLHSLGCVHRDIKPENLILCGDRAVLIDLDASRVYNMDCTQDTQILGTVGYAAPEQYGLTQTDFRADIYSAGVLFNLMLTGKHPSDVLADGRAGRIIRKCTQINPDARYQSAADLFEAL